VEMETRPLADEPPAAIPGRRTGALEPPGRLGAPEPPEKHVPAAGAQSSDANDEDCIDLGQDRVSDTLTNVIKPHIAKKPPMVEIAGEVDEATPKKKKATVPKGKATSYRHDNSADKATTSRNLQGRSTSISLGRRWTTRRDVRRQC